MQYLVYTSGKVVNKNDKTYIIKASSAKEAEKIAKNSFNEEFYVVDENIDIQLFARTRKAIVAYGFMLVPILLSFISWKKGHDTISISPTYVSCLYAMLLYSAFIVRFKGIQRTVGTWIDIVFCVMNVLLLSSFIQVLLATKSIDFLGIKEISINTNMILLVSVVLSWLGLKLISIVCMIFICFLSIINISVLSDAMGSIYGTAYIICAFLGFLLYLYIEPARMEILSYMNKEFKKGLCYMGSDVKSAGKEFRNIKNAAKSRTKINMEDVQEENVEE